MPCSAPTRGCTPTAALRAVMTPRRRGSSITTRGPTSRSRRRPRPARGSASPTGCGPDARGPLVAVPDPRHPADRTGRPRRVAALMALHYSPRLRAEILARRARPSQQFGQSDDASVFGGATGCTQTVLQWIVWRVNRRWQTLDDISRAAGYPWPGSNPRRRGMTVAEVEAVIAYYRLPYEVVRDRPALEVWRASKTGLVAAAVMYSHWPEWKGYRYRGITADGQPNGYATPLRKAGKTQLSGFDGRHMT